jgi:hypothetical protein
VKTPATRASPAPHPPGTTPPGPRNPSPAPGGAAPPTHLHPPGPKLAAAAFQSAAHAARMSDLKPLLPASVQFPEQVEDEVVYLSGHCLPMALPGSATTPPPFSSPPTAPGPLFPAPRSDLAAARAPAINPGAAEPSDEEFACDCDPNHILPGEFVGADGCCIYCTCASYCPVCSFRLYCCGAMDGPLVFP